MTTWRPAIDHSLLSPSGRISKRARKAAEDREFSRLFAAVTLRRSAQNLRDLAARGMKPRAYVRAAEKLEKEAAELESAS